MFTTKLKSFSRQALYRSFSIYHSKVVMVGGGHANCLVLKNLKQQIQEQNLKIDLTLVSETPVSYYSGMLPGAVAGLYKNEDIMVQLEPLAEWSKATFI